MFADFKNMHLPKRNRKLKKQPSALWDSFDSDYNFKQIKQEPAPPDFKKERKQLRRSGMRKIPKFKKPVVV
jgi:hypothetical protein